MSKEIRHPLSIRIYHWVQMISILMLGLTGFYIASPKTRFIFKTMDTARYLHFIFMWILVAIFIFRLYLIFGDKKGRDVFFRLKELRDFPGLMKYMLFMSSKHPQAPKYNIGQKGLYTSWMILLLAQIYTGFILYLPAKMEDSAIALGGFMVVRLIHNGIFWFFACTVPVHLYLDLTEGKEVAFSMFTGHASEPKLSKENLPGLGLGTATEEMAAGKDENNS